MKFICELSQQAAEVLPVYMHVQLLNAVRRQRPKADCHSQPSCTVAAVLNIRHFG